MSTRYKLKHKQRGGDSNTPNYSLNSLLIICVIGIVIKLFFSSPTSIDGATGPVTASVWGYGLCAVALFFLLFLNYGLVENNLGEDNTEFLKKVFTSSGAIFSTLGIFIYLIWLYMTYSTQINSGKVADEFYEMSNISTVMIIFQLIVLGKNMISSGKDATARTDMISQTVYLLTLINIVFIAIMNIILAYFSTDG